MTIEEKRCELQTLLDRGKTKKERNLLGQYSTPYPLAVDIMRYVKTIASQQEQSFLEPSIGTGTLFSAFLECFGEGGKAVGYEIDPYYCSPSKELWRGYDLDLRQKDFLSDDPKEERYSLLVANPPYSRHHHIPLEKKQELKRKVLAETGISISGLCGLYCYFVLLSTKWLEEGATACWLIPSEFMDVNYGVALKDFLINNVELVAIHRFSPDDVQFEDALVSSSIVIYKNTKPSKKLVRLSTGSSIYNPDMEKYVPLHSLQPKQKWSMLFETEQNNNAESHVIGDFFSVKRGIATGNNKFFILNIDTINKYNIPKEFLTPILPAPRNLSISEIQSHEGLPILDKSLFLFSCNTTEGQLRKDYPGVWRYIEEGVNNGVQRGANCSKRTPWYSCEVRKPSPILITYMGRSQRNGNLFRFILNDSDAVATNSYLLLYPKPQYRNKFRDEEVRRNVWTLLNNIPKEELRKCGRVYGGGLYKLEPRELMNAHIAGLEEVLGKEHSLFG